MEFFKASSPYPGKGYRQASVINIVDCTLAPPTEVDGDRYIIDNTVGTVHADWDGASKNDIVEYNSLTWGAVTPKEGWVIYGTTNGRDFEFSTIWKERNSKGEGLEGVKNFAFLSESVLTITANVLTVIQSMHTVTPESGTIDDLDSIIGMAEGEILILRLTNPTTDTITIKHGTGVNEIVTPDGEDFVFSGNGILTLIKGASYSRIQSPCNPSFFEKRTTQDIVTDTILSVVDGVKTVRVNTNAGAVSLTLHSATGWDGELDILLIEASNTLTITGTVNGVVNPTLTSLYEGMKIVADGAGNFITPDYLLP